MKRFSIFSSVLFTGLRTFLVAELCFALLYYSFINFIQLFQIFLTSTTSSIFESNSDIFGPIYILIFIVGLIGVSFIAFLEISTIIAISIYDRYRNDHIPLKSIFAFVFKKLKKLFSLKAFPIFILIIFFPKEHIGAGGIYTLEIPPFIISGILENSLYTALFSIVFFILVYFLYRSLFVIHFILLDKGNNLLDSFRKSSRLVKKVGIIGFTKLLFLNLFLLLIMSIPIILVLGIFRESILFLSGFLGNSGFFLLTIISWLEKFLFLNIPGILFLALLTVVYIENEGFSRKEFLSNFDFVDDKKQVKRLKNLRILSKKLGKSGLIIIFIAFISIFIIISSFFVKVLPWNIKEIEVLAHRGYLYKNGEEKYIENTTGAIKNAKDFGADIVEVDFFENKDASLYLLHDVSLKRIAKIPKKIYDMKDKDLNAIVINNNTKIPSLEEAFKFAKKNNIRLLVEPKIHGKEKKLYKTFVNLVKKYDMYNLVSVHSLSLGTALKIKDIDPKLKVGYTIFAGIGNLGIIPVDFFSIQETLLSSSLIDSIHETNKKVYVWTVNSTENIEKYIFMGVDGFITDEVKSVKDEIKKIRQKNKENPRFYLKVFSLKFLIPSF